MLFGVLPSGFFRPLSSANATFYARVLGALLSGPYAAASTGSASREDILRLIGQLIVDIQSAPSEDDKANTSESDARRYVYRTLLDAGWLEEVREGWRRLVEMPPVVMRFGGFLLETLPRLEDEASVGRSMAAVDSLLASAERDPSRFGHALLEADRIAQELVTNMRSAHLRARSFSRSIFLGASEEEVIRGFFDGFVRSLHLRDYKEMTNLATHPWRLRHNILDRLDRIKEDGVSLLPMQNTFVDAGIATSERHARILIEGALHGLARALDTVQDIRSNIEQLKIATERRFETSLRYRTGSGTTALIAHVLSLPIEKLDSYETRLLDLPEFFGPSVLKLPEGRRPPISSKPTPRREVDPRILAWHAEMHRYAESLNPSRETVAVQALKLLEQCDKEELEGADVTCNTLPEAILMSALLEMSVAAEIEGQGQLLEGLWVSPSPKAIQNPWLKSRTGFRLKRAA